eukprot:SAG31_NODE_17532_length_660_cov_1.095070_1_plen_31_part_01
MIQQTRAHVRFMVYFNISIRGGRIPRGAAGR